MWVMTRLYSIARIRGLGFDTRISRKSLGNDKILTGGTACRRTKRDMTKDFISSPLFDRVERARRRKTKFKDTRITLAHGGGGKAMRELIDGLFLDYLRNPLLESLEDQAVFEIGADGQNARLAFTTDSYVAPPVFFPGGDAGKLAVIGAAEIADAVVAGLRKYPNGRDACVIGEVKAEPRGMVVLETVFSGARIVDMLVGEQAPRIC
jgi:hypothetical protein